MYVFHSTVRIKPGREAEFEALAHQHKDNVRDAPGFLRRLLLKDKEHPGTYFFMAFWESFEHLQAFRDRGDTRAMVSTIIAADMDEAAVDRVECEIVQAIN